MISRNFFKLKSVSLCTFSSNFTVISKSVCLSLRPSFCLSFRLSVSQSVTHPSTLCPKAYCNASWYARVHFGKLCKNLIRNSMKFIWCQIICWIVQRNSIYLLTWLCLPRNFFHFWILENVCIASVFYTLNYFFSSFYSRRRDVW